MTVISARMEMTEVRQIGTCIAMKQPPSKTAGFKTQPHTFALSIAPTSRAWCRGCKRHVQKGEVRLETRAFVRPGRFTTFVRHVACVNGALARLVVTTHGGIERVPVGSGMTRDDERLIDEARAMVTARAASPSDFV